MQAMIFAAGFGTRLLPHTTVRPKPLFPLLNRPLLLLTIEQLLSYGFNHIVINCHHLAEQIEASVQDIPEVVLQCEETILETGGGLHLAFSSGLLRDEPLLICNGDIYHTLDLKLFYDFHCAGNSMVTLAMHDYPRFNSVRYIEDSITAFGEHSTQDTLAFTGIHAINPAWLGDFEAGCYSIIECYKTLLSQKKKIRCYRADHSNDFYWRDIGTAADYLELHGDFFHNRVPYIVGLPQLESPILCQTDDNGAIFEDWASIGKASLGKDCYICRSIIWDGVEVPAGTRLTDTIVSQYHKI